MCGSQQAINIHQLTWEFTIQTFCTSLGLWIKTWRRAVGFSSTSGAFPMLFPGQKRGAHQRDAHAAHHGPDDPARCLGIWGSAANLGKIWKKSGKTWEITWEMTWKLIGKSGKTMEDDGGISRLDPYRVTSRQCWRVTSGELNLVIDSAVSFELPTGFRELPFNYLGG